MKNAISLNGKQKKWLKKHKRKLGAEEIAKELGITIAEAERVVGKKPEVETVPAVESYVLIAVLCLAFFVLATSLGNDFLSDDIAAIPQNPLIHSWSHVTSDIVGSLQKFIYFVLVNLFGITPWPFRLMNILFHTGTTFMFYKILRQSYGFFVAIVSSALFLFSPITIEPVVWISGMPYVLGGFLAMTCFYLHTKANRTNLTMFFEVFLWILCVITVDKFLFLPVLFLIWDWKQNDLVMNKIWSILSLLFISFVRGLGLLFSFGNRVEVLSSSYYNESGFTTENPIAKVMIAIGNYIWLFFWPKDLTLYHSEVDVDWNSMLRFGTVFIVFYFCLWLLRNKIKDYWFWAIFIFVSMIPALTPFKISSLVAERYAYLSAGSMSVLVALVMNKYLLPKIGKKYFVVFIGLLISVACWRNLLRIRDWRDADSLWFSAEFISPSSWQNHNNLGDAYMNKGNYSKAIEEFNKAIDINPKYVDAMHNRSNAYMHINEVKKAKQGYLDSLKANPNMWQSYTRLSSIEATSGNFVEAINLAKKAVEISDTPTTRSWLSTLLEANKRAK